jgi:glycosyltransferase involved in cell wall biosynthesis
LLFGIEKRNQSNSFLFKADRLARRIIGVDIRDLKIAKTGARIYLQELLRNWQNNNKVRFVQLDNGLPVYNGSNKLLKAFEHLRFFCWKQIQLPLLAKFKGCDYIFCSDFFVPLFPLRARTIPVLHDAFFWEFPEHYNSLWLRLFHAVGVPAMHKAHVVIVPSEHTRRQVTKFTQLPAEKIVVVHEGARPFPPMKVAAAPFSAPYLFHLGVLEKRKNLPRLITAFAQLSETHPDLLLVLAGGVSNKQNLNDFPAIEAAIQKFGLLDKVKLMGRVSDEQAAILFSHALAYVFPSYNEGFGLPVLEAFRFGIPVAVANNSALPEVGGEAVITFDPYSVDAIFDALFKLVEDELLRQSLVKKGHERLKEFSWQQAAGEIVGVVE